MTHASAWVLCVASQVGRRLSTTGRQAALRPLLVAQMALATGLAASGALPCRVELLVLGLIAVVVTIDARRVPVANADGELLPDQATVPTAGGALPRVRLALAAAVLVLGVVVGSFAGEMRRDALERSTLLERSHGRADGPATLLASPRRSRYGGWSALARFEGEPVLLRVVTPTDPAAGEAPAQAGASASQALPDAGTIVAVEGSLLSPDAFARGRGAHAVLRTDQAAPAGRRGGLLGEVDGVRRRAEEGLGVGLTPGLAGLLKGMVLGQDAALPDDVRDDFRSAGLSHLVAASGTNVVLLAALASGLGAALGLGLSGRLWLVIGLIVLYVPLAGGGASIQRAGIMGAAVAVAGLLGRPAARWHGLGLAAVITLGLDPRAVSDPGWQLSFAAVLGIAVYAGGWRTGLERYGVPGAVAEVLAMTAAATVATAPIVAAHFDDGSAWAVPVNLVAAPIVAPIMWLGLAVASIAQLAALGDGYAAVVMPLCGVIDAVAGFGVGFLAWLAHIASGLPGARVAAGPGIVLGACAAVVVATRSQRARRAAPVGALTAALVAVALEPEPAAVPPVRGGTLRVTFLDVGQGDATLLQQGGSTVLVDTGPPDADVVTDLHRRGVRRLDLLVVTHADADHSGGGAAVLRSLSVGLVLDGRDGVDGPEAHAVGVVASQRHVRLLRPAAGQRLTLRGGLTLRVLWPRPESAAAHAGADPNERAIVLEATGATGGRVLLGADAESDVLLGLPLRAVDVLKVSHHGSADPGLPALLGRLKPLVAGIEVGEGNTYGHPAPSTLLALRVVRSVVRTDRDGDVRLDRDPEGRWLVHTHS